MRERRTHGSVRGLRREPLVYSTDILENRDLIKEHDKYVMVYLRRNSIHCIRYFRFFEARFDMENNRTMEILSCR